MRIFHFIDSLNIGGSERQVAEVVRRQVSSYDVRVGCLSARGALLPIVEQLGISVEEFSPRGSFFSRHGAREFLRLTRYLRREKIEIFHAHDLYSNLMGVPAAWLARVPVIVSSRRDLGSWWWYTPRNRRLLRYIQGMSSVVLANSEKVRDHLVENDGFRKEQIVVVYNGVDCGPFEQLQSHRELIPGVAPDDVLAIQVANMHVHTKGHTFLIEAAAQLCPRFEKLKFVLVGDGELRPEFEKKVAELGLSSKFVFMGARTDVVELLASCDVGMLVSLAEGLPNSVLEYSAAGLPVVGTEVGGIPEIVVDGETGFIVPPKDPEAIAEALTNLVADREKAKQMGVAGRARVRRVFSYERLISQLEGIYAGARKS